MQKVAEIIIIKQQQKRINTYQSERSGIMNCPSVTDTFIYNTHQNDNI